MHIMSSDNKNLFSDASEIVTEKDKQMLLSTIDHAIVPGNVRTTAIFLAWPTEGNSSFTVSLIGMESALRGLIVEAMLADKELAHLLHVAVAVHKAIAPTNTTPQVHVDTIKINKN